MYATVSERSLPQKSAPAAGTPSRSAGVGAACESALCGSSGAVSRRRTKGTVELGRCEVVMARVAAEKAHGPGAESPGERRHHKVATELMRTEHVATVNPTVALPTDRGNTISG
eukprot:2794340-Prymnesium_polylepis.1